MSATDACRHCGLPISEPEARHTGPALGFCCFGCSIAHEITQSSAGRTEGSLSPVHVRIALAVLFAMAVMMFSLISYSDFVAWDEDPEAVTGAFSQLFSYLAFLCTLPVIVLLERPMLRRFRDARLGHSVWLEVLVLLGVSAAFVLSAVNLIRGVGHTYFETVVFTLLLWSVGRYVEALVRTKTMTSIRDAVAGSRQKIERVRSGEPGAEVETVDRKELCKDDIIRLHAGDLVETDGEIVRGCAFIDESVTTGEFVPASRFKGEHLVAGSFVVDATIDLRLTANPEDGSLSRLGEVVARAVTERGRISQAADRASRVLVFVTLALGFGTFAWWLKGSGVETAVLNALSVFLVACPCSLGIAVPLVVFFGLQTARQRGALFRSGEALERAAKIDKLYLDKTGTLTAGLPCFKSMQTARNSPVDGDTLWRAIVAMETQTRHPFGRAVTSSAVAKVAPLNLEECKVVPGAGMIAQADGISGVIRIGTKKWMETERITIPDDLAARLVDLTRRAHPASVVSVGESAVALLEFREDSEAETVDVLRRLDQFHPEIITGAATVTGALSEWPAHTGVDTNGKAAMIAQSRGRGETVAMAGDGLNDAVALAESDLSIAVHGAQDINRVVADVQLLTPGPGALGAVFEVARLARRRIWQNIGWSIAYNSIGLFLAVTGNLHPLAAAFAMFGSSLLVLWNSRRWHEHSR